MWMKVNFVESSLLRVRVETSMAAGSQQPAIFTFHFTHQCVLFAPAAADFTFHNAGIFQSHQFFPRYYGSSRFYSIAFTVYQQISFWSNKTPHPYIF
jgi:hypothetical protein